MAAITTAQSNTTVSPAAIGKAEKIRFATVAAVPIAKYTSRSAPSVLHKMTCFVTHTREDGTADPTAAFEAVKATGPTSLFSVLSPTAITD